MKHAKYLLIPLLALSCNDNKDEAQQYPKPEIIVVGAKQQQSAEEKSLRQEIVAYAEKFLGTKYCYAGSSPEEGFDCSGFVNYVFKNFDIELPRSSSGFEGLGDALEPEDFRVGDVLVFYGYRDSDSVGHVGIVYEANGMESKFIHASSGSEYAVMISDLGSNMYTRRFYKCIDVINLKK